MRTPRLHLISPAQIAEAVRHSSLRTGLEDLIRLAGAELTLCGPDDAPASTPPETPICQVPIGYRDTTAGRILYEPIEGDSTLPRIAGALRFVYEHLVEREEAVADLADAMLTSYEELNMLYALLPGVATKVDAAEIAEVLVEEASRILRCHRVSLLVLDERQTHLRVLASRGLPPEVRQTAIPVSDTITARALFEDGLCVVNDIAERPDLQELSRGQYDTAAFAVIRVPLHAQGRPIGALTVTERVDGGEFSARDRKLLEGLSAMGASALLNCRLHSVVNRQMMSTITALASAVDAKDRYTHDHSGRVARFAVATAGVLELGDTTSLREVELAGLLHDIVKIGIPDSILSKNGPLTPAEFAVIKTHSDIGAGIVEHVDGLERVADAIRHHHERYDGLGYPGGLSSDAIPIISRLITVADVFDSLTSDRPYRKRVGTAAALQELRRSRGSWLDPLVVDAFLTIAPREHGPARVEVPA